MLAISFFIERIEPEWDDLVTSKLNTLAFRVMRPLLAGLVVLTAMQIVRISNTVTPVSEPVQKVIRIPAA